MAEKTSIQTTPNWLQRSVEEIGKPYQDLQFLLEALREVFIENGQQELADHIPWINEKPKTLPEELTEQLVQVYSIAFQLLNMAEENGAVQNRRRVENSNVERIPGLWSTNLKMLSDADVDAATIAKHLPEVRIEPVFTAHPTEAKRATILEHHRELYKLIVQRENQMYTQTEQEEIRREVKLALDRIWRTGEIYLEKPDVSSELRNVMHYLMNVLPVVIPILDRRLQQAWAKAGFDETLIQRADNMPRIAFGNWVGGDRDGHPFVTDDTTRETLQKLRLNAMVIIRRELVKLIRHLSFTHHLVDTPRPYQKRMAAILEELGEMGQIAYGRNPNETFRQFTNLITYKLPVEVQRDHATRIHEHAGAYRRPEDLINDLRILQDALVDYGAEKIAYNDVNKVIRIVQTFGFHLAHLDVRQNSSFHDKAIQQLLQAASMDEAKSFMDWEEEQRLAFFNNELQSLRPFTHPDTELSKQAHAVRSCYRVLNDHVSKYGSQAIGALIVSMTRSLSDLLAVYLLAREAGLLMQTEEGNICQLPVVPLFETIEDLQNSHLILDAFLSHPMTKASLKYLKKDRNDPDLIQQVMIGYSDSNKDGGILASQWNLFDAQSRLAEVGRRHGVKIRFFHGKGGSISRGAGPTHYFIKNLPPHSVRGEMRLTEQGETISQKYANKINATYNLELLLANTAGVSIRDRFGSEADKSTAEILRYMGEKSYQHYRKLIEHPHFIHFYSEATPIDVIEQSKIGSRPSRRRGERTLDDLRAIPWVFSWAQSRFNLTSWYGVGATLKQLKEEQPEWFEKIKAAAHQNSLVRYVLYNVDTSLESTDEAIMESYAKLVSDEEVRDTIFGMIQEELKLIREVLYDDIFGTPFGERRRHHHYSTQLRAQALDRLHYKQIELLKKWRLLKKIPDAQASQEDVLRQLLLTVNAIASALRVTG